MAAHRFPFPILVGDIGGTNARFAIVEEGHEGIKDYWAVATGNFARIEDAIKAAVLANTDVLPKTAIIAVAGPVDGDEVDLTNANWIINPREVIAHLGFEEMVLLNDFEAMALALVSLDENDVVAVGGGRREALGAKVVLGPGTGLGVAGLVRNSGIWLPVPGEGGHISIGPAEPEEFAIWPHIEPEFGRISAESLLAGRGIPRLYRAVCGRANIDPIFDDPAAVTDAALADTDLLAVETIRIYCQLLGRVAGDLALIFMANGGVYVGGGIAPRLIPLLKSGPFRREFENKMPHGQALGNIQTAIITADRPALKGIAAYARNPSLFGVSLEGRRWTRPDDS